MAEVFSGAVASSPTTIADTTILSGLTDVASQRRDFWDTLLDRYPDRAKIENGFVARRVGNRAFIGIMKDTANIFHAEEDSVLQTVTVTSFTGGASAGAPATITIVADTFGSTPLYVNYATVGQLFQIAANPSVSMRVSARSLPDNSATHTITVYPVDPTVQLDAELAASGDILLPQDAVYNIGDTFPEGSTRGWNRYSVPFQYMMTSSAKMGIDAYNQTFEFALADGKNYIAPRLFRDAILTDLMRTSVLICKGSGSTTTDAAGGTMQLAMGYITAITTYGQSDTYANGAFQEDDFLNVDDQLEAAGAGTHIEIDAGFAWLRSTQFNIQGAYQQGGIQYLSGEGYNAGTRAQLKKTLGSLVFGKFVHDLYESSEWGHKEMYSPIDGTTGTQTNSYWANSAAWTPNEMIDIPKALTNTSYNVSAPMFRVLQLANPTVIDGPMQMNRVYRVNPENRQSETYYMTIAKNVGPQTMLASKLYFAAGS